MALPWLRGRAGLPPAGQAAQQHARTRLGLLGIGDLPVTDIRALTPRGAEVERWTVTMTGPDGDVVATVESRPSDAATHLTCRATHPAHSRTWHVQALSTASSATAESAKPAAASSASTTCTRRGPCRSIATPIGSWASA